MNEWTITIGYAVDGGYYVCAFHFYWWKNSVNNFCFMFFIFMLFLLSLMLICVCIEKCEKLPEKKKVIISIVRGILLKMKNRPLLLPLIWFRQYSNKYAQCFVLLCLCFQSSVHRFVCIFIESMKPQQQQYILYFWFSPLFVFACFFLDDECVHKNNNLLIFRWVYISNKYTREF